MPLAAKVLGANLGERYRRLGSAYLSNRTINDVR